MNKKKYDWKTIKADYKTYSNQAARSFEVATAKLSDNFANVNDRQKSELIAQINKILARADITAANTKLLRLAQQIIAKNKDGFTANNIRKLTGAIKDIESVSNPKPNTDIQANNDNSQNSVIEFIKS